MLFNIIGLVIGALLFAAGLYFLIRERTDAESRKIYGIACAIGAAVLVVMIIRTLITI